MANEIKVGLSRVHPDKITDTSLGRPGEATDEIYVVVSGKRYPNRDPNSGEEYSNRIPGDIWRLRKGYSTGETTLARFDHGPNELVFLSISVFEQDNTDLDVVAWVVELATQSFGIYAQATGAVVANYLRSIGADEHQLVGTIGLTYETDGDAKLTNQRWFAGVDARNEGTVYRGPNRGEFRPGSAGSAAPHPQRFWLTGFGSRYDFELAVEHSDQYKWPC